jgi:ribosomal protein S27AE
MWTKGNKEDHYSINDSELKRKVCPKCNNTITEKHLTKIDSDSEDVFGWHYDHPCGAKLLIIND